VLTSPVHLQSVQRCSWSHVGSSLWVSGLGTYWSCTSHCARVQAPAVCGYRDAGWILQVQWPQSLLPPERHNTHTMLVGWILSKEGTDLSQIKMDYQFAAHTTTQLQSPCYYCTANRKRDRYEADIVTTFYLQGPCYGLLNFLTSGNLSNHILVCTMKNWMQSPETGQCW